MRGEVEVLDRGDEQRAVPVVQPGREAPPHQRRHHEPRLDGQHQPDERTDAHHQRADGDPQQQTKQLRDLVDTISKLEATQASREVEYNRTLEEARAEMYISGLDNTTETQFNLTRAERKASKVVAMNKFIKEKMLRKMEEKNTLVRQMKADPALKDVPIIVVTTMATAGDESKVLETGADAYLAKPIQVDQFIEAVRSTLGR